MDPAAPVTTIVRLRTSEADISRSISRSSRPTRSSAVSCRSLDSALRGNQSYAAGKMKTGSWAARHS